MASEGKYKVVGTSPVCGVPPEGTLTDEELEAHGADVEFLTSIGAIRKQRAAPSTVEPSKTSKKSKELTDG